MYTNAGEWLVHKYVLHGLGRNKDSFWAFHWKDHHRAVRQGRPRREGGPPELMVDDCYTEPVWGWNPQGKEALCLSLAAAAHLPLLPIAPLFTGTVLYGIWNYYRVHKRSHLDPQWAREHLPWHYDHHLGPNQHSNWCVTRPWLDELLGTREPYVGTDRERRDRERRARREGRVESEPRAETA